MIRHIDDVVLMTEEEFQKLKSDRDAAIRRAETSEAERVEIREQLEDLRSEYGDAAVAAGRVLGEIGADVSTNLVKNIGALAQALQKEKRKRTEAETDREDWRRRAIAAEKETTRIGQASVVMKNIADQCEAGDVVCAVSEKQWRAVVDERDSLVIQNRHLLDNRRITSDHFGKIRDAIGATTAELTIDAAKRVAGERDEWKRKAEAAGMDRDLIKTELDTTRSALSIALAAGNAMLRNDKSRKLADPIAQAKAEVELLSNVAEWHEKEAARLKEDAGRFLSMIDDAASGGKTG